MKVRHWCFVKVMDHVLTLHVTAISDIKLVMVFFSDLLLSVEYKVSSDSGYIYRCAQSYYAAPYIKNLFPKMKCVVVDNKQTLGTESFTRWLVGVPERKGFRASRKH